PGHDKGLPVQGMRRTVQRDRQTAHVSLLPVRRRNRAMNDSACDDVLLVKGAHSFLLVAPVSEDFPLCIEASLEEYIQGVHAGDVVVVSAPGGGPVEPALMLLALVRTYHLPLLVLPRIQQRSRWNGSTRARAADFLSGTFSRSVSPLKNRLGKVNNNTYIVIFTKYCTAVSGGLDEN